MEDRPPVPPKDTTYAAGMDLEREPASGSKRKYDNDDELDDVDTHTPKRQRSTLRPTDAELSEDSTPLHQRNLRRKQKVGNLSSLNLRHQAEQQAAQQASVEARESKFQEGSLTDKPSAKPPSVFTKMVRTDSGNIRQVDELMEDYHADAVTAGDPVDMAVTHEKSQMSQRVEEIAEQSAETEESGGFFRFGRSFASNFHPVALWNRMWNETKEELIRRNKEEALRKQREAQKEAAEAEYARLKQSGQLGLKPVGKLATDLPTIVDGSTPRDSAVVMVSTRTSQEHNRTASNGSQLLLPPKDDVSMHSGSEAPETASKTRTLRSRMNVFKRPSMVSLKDGFKGGLKRVTSDLNLAAPLNRESSSSESPKKHEFGTLKKSHSRIDLNKQTKLSKRVSDLEHKLQIARQELDDALVEASPKPKLNNKYERFTPQSTLKRPKFIPGKLPSLPSERILMAEQMGFGDDEQSPDKEMTEGQPRKALDLSEAEGGDTVRASRDQTYPLRASSLFQLDNNSSEQQQSTIKTNKIANDEPSEPTQHTSEPSNMDADNVTNPTNEGSSELMKTVDYGSLDAKLKALEKNVKTTRKQSGRPKKRKSGADDDAPFKPGNASEDDTEWTETNQKSRKKRKSAVGNGTVAGNKRGRAASGAQSSPAGKKARGNAKAANKSSPMRLKVDSTQDITEHDDDHSSEDNEDDANAGAGDVDETAHARTSIDSQGLPLEPLIEEEETTAVPLNKELSKPTAHATPARFGRQTPRSRSTSPYKRTAPVLPAAEETMITRAAEAAQQHPGRQGRSRSPPPANGVKQTMQVVHETVSMKSGEVGVSMLTGADLGFERREDTVKNVMTEVEVVKKTVTNGQKEDFQWPEDVF